MRNARSAGCSQLKGMENNGTVGKSSTRAHSGRCNAGIMNIDRNVGRGSFVDTMQNIGMSTAKDACIDVGFSALSSAASNFSSYRDGKISGTEFVENVVVEAAKTAGEKAIRKGAALAVKESGKALGKQLGSAGLRRFAGSNAGTQAAFAVVDIGYNAIQCARGKISGAEFAKNSATATASAAGSYGGAVGGAAIGSMICPGIGTVIGGLIGSIGGGMAGGGLVEEVCSLWK